MKKVIVTLMLIAVSTACFAKKNEERDNTKSNDVWCGTMCDMDGGNCQNTCAN
jgi:hypothetical protein